MWPVNSAVKSTAAATLVLLLSAGADLVTPQAQEGVPLGLDHMPVAVRDLERAAATYRALGFSLKPGRPHANGIRNVHVKFPDGSGVELLAAPKGVDDLSSHYVKFLAAGEGPAFISFHDRNNARMQAALQRGGYRVHESGGITTLDAPELSWLFLGNDNRSPTDRPEHFAHPNGATAMRAVWLAPDNLEAVIRLLVHLGGRQERRRVTVPAAVDATVVRLSNGEVVILPKDQQRLARRPVIGASFTVRDIEHVRRLLAAAKIPSRSGDASAGRVLVEPLHAHGLWLEFVGAR